MTKRTCDCPDDEGYGDEDPCYYCGYTAALTVAQLIEKLKQMPQDLVCKFESEADGSAVLENIAEVRISVDNVGNKYMEIVSNDI